jgi:hypothetical protein
VRWASGLIAVVDRVFKKRLQKHDHYLLDDPLPINDDVQSVVVLVKWNLPKAYGDCVMEALETSHY